MLSGKSPPKATARVECDLACLTRPVMLWRDYLHEGIICMMRLARQCGFWTTCLALGCSGPKHPEIQVFNAVEVTERAMNHLDDDGDGKLSKAELKECPGLFRSRKLIDQDNDNAISSTELQARLQAYLDEQLAIVDRPIHIQRGGRQLTGATVELLPEGFMADIIEPASGTTDERGIVRPSIELDEEIRGVGTRGYRSGVYRVKVSKKDSSGKELLPKKYNKETTLGIEVKQEEHFEPIYLRL